jgi:hypothetical protein
MQLFIYILLGPIPVGSSTMSATYVCIVQHSQNFHKLSPGYRNLLVKRGPNPTTESYM